MRNTLTVLLGAAALAAGLATAARPASAATSMSLGYYDGQVQSGDTSGMDAFPVTSATAIHYNCWTCTFPSSVARTLWADGHTRIFVEMESWNDGGSPLPHGDVPVTDITAGEYDSYLARFADAVAAFGHPVYLTFDHEMNGDWYPWGWHGSDGITPAQWQSAWIHVRSVINTELTADTANVQLVKWVWAPNVNCGGTTCTDLASYYPGDSFVAVKGLDGYLNSTSDTYSRVFGSSVTDERGLGTHAKPVWITETGANASLGDPAQGNEVAAEITDARNAGIFSLYYFNSGKYVLSPGAKTAFANAWAG